MQFAELLNQHILLTIPRMHPTKFQKVKLEGVESGGLWISSQDITNSVLQMTGASSAPRTPVIFLPWHQISEATHYLDATALNEKAFGV